MSKNIKSIIEVINYIENHLHEKLCLDIVAYAVHYSKYHLHRIFTNTVNLTVHNYIQRRRLTEAAKLLVFSDIPILKIALTFGYESQQSFTDAFKAMYKKSPKQYREEKKFYPLQLKYILNEHIAYLEKETNWNKKIIFATNEDILDCIKLLHTVIDGFPHLNETQFIEQLQKYIKNGQVFILKDVNIIIGIIAFHAITRNIDFLGIHPQYRKKGIEKAFFKKVYEFAHFDTITITTFRKGDKADTGYRKMLKNIGFVEAELLYEFGYPTQRLILHKKILEDTTNESDIHKRKSLSTKL
ncbi:GNAT family N-acetyltransferase [Lachnospiraceae bacterium 46-61]